MSESIDKLMRQFIAGESIGLRDGSYIQLLQLGAAAQIICTKAVSQWICGGGVIPGQNDDQSAYRSK